MIQNNWRQHPILTQALGLCPLLAMSNTVQNALYLGLLTWLIMSINAVLMRCITHAIPHYLRLVFTVFCLSVLVTCLHLLLQVFAPHIVLHLGIFLPLIACNSLIYAQLEQRQSLFNQCFIGLQFALLIIFLGLARDFLAHNAFLSIGFFALPCGALLSFALCVAIKNAIEQRFFPMPTQHLIDSQQRRQRVTGRIA